MPRAGIIVTDLNKRELAQPKVAQITSAVGGELPWRVSGKKNDGSVDAQ